MKDDSNYKRAYERQRMAREKAESLLEVRSRELFDANRTLQSAYDKLTEQKNHLVQQEKLASIGLLAAGVAHEINNPVGFVKSNLQTLEEYTNSYTAVLNAYRAVVSQIEKNDSKNVASKIDELKELLLATNLNEIAKDGLDCIHESLLGISRIEEIIANLSDFARTESDDRILCNINDLLDSTLKLVWNEIKYNCEVTKDYSELPSIYGRPGQLQQVFVNIIVNAAQAVGSRGSLVIQTQVIDEKISIEFEDNGPGIEESNISKLFDPFFTTKEVGVGTGLGLYVSHGIIKGHHGTISAKNTSLGAKFKILLPIEMRRNRND